MKDDIVESNIVVFDVKNIQTYNKTFGDNVFFNWDSLFNFFTVYKKV